MEKEYAVRGFRKIRTFWGEIMQASVYLGDRQIGTLKECPDSGKAEVKFPLGTDKIVFESFINQWWSGVRPFAVYDGHALELASSSSMYNPSMAEKIRYWIKSVHAIENADHADHAHETKMAA